MEDCPKRTGDGNMMKLIHVRLEKGLERVYGRWNTKTEGRTSFTYIRDSLFSRDLKTQMLLLMKNVISFGRHCVNEILYLSKNEYAENRS